MRRLIGTLLIGHGLAHADAGMWATSARPNAFVTFLWWVAMVGFITAGTGLLGLPRVDRDWRALAVAASFASLALLALLALDPHPVLLLGAAVDGAILLDSIPFVHATVARDLGLMVHPPHRRLGRIGTAVATIAILYVSLVVLTRPWHSTGGVSNGELVAPLSGDELLAADGGSIVHPDVTVRGAGTPSLGAVAVAPFGLLVQEPAHFIMQRGMLPGIRDRAEHTRRQR